MHSRRTAGFTLIELLAVVAIVAVLAALLYPTKRASMEQARYTQVRAWNHNASIRFYLNFDTTED